MNETENGLNTKNKTCTKCGAAVKRRDNYRAGNALMWFAIAMFIVDLVFFRSFYPIALLALVFTARQLLDEKEKYYYECSVCGPLERAKNLGSEEER